MFQLRLISDKLSPWHLTNLKKATDFCFKRHPIYIEKTGNHTFEHAWREAQTHENWKKWLYSNVNSSKNFKPVFSEWIVHELAMCSLNTTEKEYEADQKMKSSD